MSRFAPSRRRPLWRVLAGATFILALLIVTTAPWDTPGSQAVFTGTTNTGATVRLATLVTPANVNCSGSTISWDDMPYATSYYVEKPLGGSSTVNDPAHSTNITIAGTYRITAKLGAWSSPTESVFASWVVITYVC